ncbi:MAG TPA: deoxyhypusine synthase [Candidatus Nitrosocosmicus sp.]
MIDNYKPKLDKSLFLKQTIEHIDIIKFDCRSMIEGMRFMAFQSRNLARACDIYDKMLEESDLTIILCLSGSLISAGLKKVIIEMLSNNMIDVIVSTGANIVDQDFFESIGFKHYIGNPFTDDKILQENHVDRIYDTFIDEDELRICDNTITDIADSLPSQSYSSREFILEMGKYLYGKNVKQSESITLIAYNKGVPIFVPAFSDSSAGFGLVKHQFNKLADKNYLSIDSVKDFRELTNLKIKNKETGIIIIGGGVPKNFTQDIVVAAEILEKDVPMHKYAIQLTVADERDGALSGSTLKEANSWGKVDSTFEQMVYGEATITFPILASFAYHNKKWINRKEKRLNDDL